VQQPIRLTDVPENEIGWLLCWQVQAKTKKYD
jgi:hypothetical protein